MIEKIIPGTDTKLRILKIIYEDKYINLSNLIKRAKTSPNLVLSYINKLVNFNVVAEQKSGGKIKVHIRNLMPNFKSNESKAIYSLIELDKKEIFFKKYKNLKIIFEQLYDLFDENIKFVIVYGSYARFSATKESDLDLLIVGKLNDEKRKRLREAFITLDIEPSIKIETLKHFKNNLNKPLYKNIIKEHVIVYGEYSFINMLDSLRVVELNKRVPMNT